MAKELQSRHWAGVQWMLTREGTKAGKYTYTVQVREVIQLPSGRGVYGKWVVKLVTKSLKLARKEYKIMSYNLRTKSQAGVA